MGFSGAGEGLLTAGLGSPPPPSHPSSPEPSRSRPPPALLCSDRKRQALEAARYLFLAFAPLLPPERVIYEQCRGFILQAAPSVQFTPPCSRGSLATLGLSEGQGLPLDFLDCLNSSCKVATFLKFCERTFGNNTKPACSQRGDPPNAFPMPPLPCQPNPSPG